MSLTDSNIITDSYSFCNYLIDKKIPKSTQIRLRKKIKEELIEESDFKHLKIIPDNIKKILTVDLLKHMFDLYNEYFFDDLLKTYMTANMCSLNFCIDYKCFKTAGRCFLGQGGKCLTIELASKTFFNAFKQKERTQGDIKCKDMLDEIMLTFEHELIHGILSCFCPDWAYYKKFKRNIHNTTPYRRPPSDRIQWSGTCRPSNGHSKVFMEVLNNIFGHTSFTHDLFGSGSKDKLEETQLKMLKSLLTNGMKISFKGLKRGDKKLYDFEGDIERKMIKNIKTKVMIDGIPYMYNVPLSQILKVNGQSTLSFINGESGGGGASANVPSDGGGAANVPSDSGGGGAAKKSGLTKSKKVNSVDKNQLLKSLLTNGMRISFKGKKRGDKKKYEFEGIIVKKMIKNIKTKVMIDRKEYIYHVPLPGILKVDGEPVDDFIEDNMSILQIKGKSKTSEAKNPIKIKKSKSKQKIKKVPSKKYGRVKDRNGKIHKSKVIKEGECIFPFKYKGKMHNDCLDTGKGPWCPTIALKKTKTVNTYGYCD